MARYRRRRRPRYTSTTSAPVGTPDATGAANAPQRNWDFQNWGEYLAALPQIDGARAGRWNPNDIGGVRTTAGAIVLAKHGWPEGMAYVNRLAMPLAESVMTTRTQDGWGWDVTGAAYDVGEYLSGTPECWLIPTAEQSRPVVTIQADIALRASIPGDVVTRRGAGVVALVLALQAAGYVVQCSAIIGSGIGPNQYYWVRVPLVDPNGGPLDTDRLLFALAHPASPRVLGFGLGAVLWGERTAEAYCQGGTNPYTADIMLPRIQERDADWQSESAVSAWVKATFEKITHPNGGA